MVLFRHSVSGLHASINRAAHFIHSNREGVWLQFAVSVSAAPSVGVAELAATVQVGAPDAALCQLNASIAGALLPRAFVPMTP